MTQDGGKDVGSTSALATTAAQSHLSSMHRRSGFLFVVIGLLALLTVYVGARLIPESWSLVPIVVGWGALGALTAIPAITVLAGGGRRRVPLSLLALFVFLLSFTLLRDLVMLVVGLFGPVDIRDASSVAVVGLALATLAVATVRGRATPVVTHVDVPVPSLHPDLEGFTIVQLSDVHIGQTLRRPFLQGVVDTVNGLQADMVAITGDLVDGGVDDLGSETEPLGELKARHGTFFVTGNHDYYSGALPWIEELRRLGLTVLINEHRVLEHDGGRLVVGGITDHSANGAVPGHGSDPHAAIRGAPDDVFKVLLAHQPASAPGGAEAGFNLQLSGHTHGGQFFPGTWFAHLVFPFVDGLKRQGPMWIYTSKGTGHVGAALRTVPSEITRLRLVRATG